ncbi:MAG: Ig-like domain-containing protein [Deltaproteobacteria bacterium]|nr:Ig-like domain-containing protein [Deltaproteobacteria bacterium]
MVSFSRTPSRSLARLCAALMVLLGAAATLAGRASAQTATETPTPLPTVTATPALVRVGVAPRTAKRQVGQVQNFTVTGYFSDGGEKNLTQKVVYSSSNLAAVYPPNTEGNRGRVEAVGVGVSTISATEPTTGTSSDASGESAMMEVVEAPTPTPTSTNPTPTRTATPKPTATTTPVLQTLRLSPLVAKRKVGESQNFSVVGVYSDGSEKNLTQQATYVSSTPTVVQAPNDATTNKGRTLAVGPGVATISAAFGGVNTTDTGGDATFTVTAAPTPTPTRTGATPTRTLSPTPTVTATPVLVSLALSPASTKRGVGAAQNFVATGTLSDGTTKNLTQRVTYTSSDPAVAAAPNEAANRGRVVAVGVGTATISAVDDATGVGTTASGGNATFEVVVAPTPTPTTTGITPTRTKTPTPAPTATPRLVALAISPTTVKKAVGLTQTFTVSGMYSDGSTKNLTQKVEYSSSDPAVAATGTDPSSKSKVLAVAPGVAVIRAEDAATGIVTAVDESAVFTVVEAPSPTPTHTGPTSTAPTGTPTGTPSPSPSPTPVIVKLALKPQAAQKPIGTAQFFTATATLSDGAEKNVTQKVTYVSSDPAIAEAPNADGNRGRIVPVAVGTVTISVFDPASGVTSTASGGDATFTVVAGSGSPSPRATATPGLPIQVGNAKTACQRDVRRAARSYVDKKLKTLDRCAGAAGACVQRRPNDPACLAAVGDRCAAALGKLATAEARLVAAVTRRCAGLGSADLFGPDGLAYDDIAEHCLMRYGRALADLTGIAQCLSAEHSCRAETLFALQRPRAGELLRLIGAAPDGGACRTDFGGSGAGLGDPKGLGRGVERCAQALVRSGAGLARTRLGAIGRCVDAVFLCVAADPGNAACLAKATQRCTREFGKVQRAVGTLTVAVSRRCDPLAFAVLTDPAGANLDAVAPRCPSYGIPAVASVGDYVACLVRQHECEVAELVRFESPRAEAMLDLAGRTLIDGVCPAP